MFATRFAVPLLCLAVCLGCGSAEKPISEAEKTRAAIQRVLETHRDLAARRDQAFAIITSSRQAALEMERFCTDQERIDLTGCPADFRVAMRQHARACHGIHEAAVQLPDSLTEGFVMGLVNSAVRGERDGGFNRLTSQMDQAITTAKGTYQEVERIGASYGAAL